MALAPPRSLAASATTQTHPTADAASQTVGVVASTAAVHPPLPSAVSSNDIVKHFLKAELLDWSRLTGTLLRDPS